MLGHQLAGMVATVADLSARTSEWVARVNILEDRATAMQAQTRDEVDTLRAMVVSMGYRVGELEVPLPKEFPPSDEEAGPSAAAPRVDAPPPTKEEPKDAGKPPPRAPSPI